MYSLKTKLKNGELVVGTMISEVHNPNLAYMLAQCGFDYFIIDNEHGTYSSESVTNMIAAARGANISVIVRIPEITRENIMKPLDSGAAGLLVPQVDTAEQAQEIIRHAKYQPDGSRGVGLRRAHSLYKRVKAVDYLKQANENTFIAVQAETTESIQNLEQIVAVPGIDAVFVGPFDLSVSLGIPGEVTHPKEIEAIDKVVAVCQRNQIISGILMFDLDALKPWLEKGMRLIAYSSDISMLADAAAKAVSELKSLGK